MKNSTSVRTHVLLTVVSIPLLLAGCSGSSSSPTDPFGGGLVVRPDATATQIEPNGFRLQVRYDLVSGNLAQAVGNGSASARVCVAGTCVDGPISPNFGEASCQGVNLIPANGNSIGFGLAWFAGGEGGVDFCIGDLVVDQVFETTVSNGRDRSNTIRTACTLLGGRLGCASSG